MRGEAYTLEKLTHEGALSAFFVIEVDSSESGFAHELGHIMGCGHAEGYISPNNDWRTVMIIPGPGIPPRIPYYSNPDVMYNGVPTGTTTQNNALVIQTNAFNVANFRTHVVKATFPDTIYVDMNVELEGDGHSWNTAFKDLQHAFCVAGGSGKQVREIWVAEGTYKPDKGTGDRKASFRILTGVAIYGGFPHGGCRFEDRDPNTFKTVLSGDLLGDDETGNISDNSYNVVSASGCEPNAVLDGFTISGGNANGDVWPFNTGGGIFLRWGRPNIKNCSFIDNFGIYGAGAYCRELPSSPTFEHCSFISNTSEQDGGAIRVYRCEAQLANCHFESNYAIDDGGAVSSFEAHPIFQKSTFIANTSLSNGGAVYDIRGNSTFSKCIFERNAGGYGGAAHIRESSTASFTGCLFEDNTATERGGGVRNHTCSSHFTGCTFENNTSSKNGGGAHNEGGDAIFTNCRFINNIAQDSDGGGVFNNGGSSQFSKCVFKNNRSGWGAGVYNDNGSDASFERCLFTENTAWNMGGAMRNHRSSSPDISNSIFWANQSERRGGTIANAGDSIVKLTNCTITDNMAIQSAGGIRVADNARGLLQNCIVWDNSDRSGVSENAQLYETGNGEFTVSYSCIQDWSGRYGGIGNIGDDPLLIGAVNGDFHLTEGSPCIDAGDPDYAHAAGLIDFYRAPRVVGAEIDMGVSEYLPIGRIDANGDGIVNLLDYAPIAECWQNLDEDLTILQKVDITGDGIVDILDLAGVAIHWLETH